MIRKLFAAVALGAAVTGCNGALDAHLAGVYDPPTGAPSPAPTPSPGASGLPQSCPEGGSLYQLTGAAIVLMTSAATGATSTYGRVAGYANNDTVPTPTPSSFPAAPITVSKATYTSVQFYNFDSAGVHAAAGIAGSSFPPTYSFPSGATGSTIDAGGAWGTGPVGPGCFSAAFALPATGTFYFGDPSAYASGVRDVLQVTP